MNKTENIKLNAQYYEFSQVLLAYLESTYIDEGEKDINTIKRYMGEFDSEDVQQAIAEGKELLLLDPFPAEWVLSTCNRYPEGKSHETTDEDVYHWVKWMVKALEEEARKAGKL